VKKRILIWSLLGLICVTAFARSSHAKSSKPTPAPVTPAAPAATPAPVAPLATIVPAAAKLQNPGNFIALHSGYGIQSSSLTGTGFNSDLSGAMGLIYGAEISHQSANTGIRYSLKFENASAEQEAPAGVTPADITVLREEYRFVASIPTWNSGGEDLRLGIGYSFLQTGATDTLPNNVMTKQSSQGVILNAAYQVKVNPEWSVGTEVLLYLPHKVQESPQVTGYNPNFVGAEVKILVDYTFSEQLVGFIGASYRMDQVSYEGTVDRGVTDGHDSRNLFAIPVGLKIGY
jgi:hypothetical protein